MAERFDPLPYCARLEARSLEAIDGVVIHCTELPDLATARAYGERIHYPESGTGNAGHYYIEHDGRVHQWVPLNRIAHHVRGYNPRSVGIELCNPGRYPDWFDSRHQAMTEPYPEAQIDALIDLLQNLLDTLPSLGWISGHEVLDTARVPASDDPERRVYRKRDPGPLFPWSRVLAAVGLDWYDPAGADPRDRPAD
ncbi:MAG: N-acetylmuramoyl-L-alanine amidase [Xanthomonadales bacterium]